MGVISSKFQKMDHPHIVKVNGICGGAAIIENTRIAVWHIVEYYYSIGMTIEEILLEWDYLSPSQIFSALSYYHDHHEEIGRIREENSYGYWEKNLSELTT